jgi:Prp8 binding protein
MIYLWDVFDPACRNFGVLKGHKNAILHLTWGGEIDSSRLFSSSADKHVIIWDTYKLERIRKLKGHQGVINSIDVVKRGSELVRNK